jgi:16S rRNA processing protein RimM
VTRGLPRLLTLGASVEVAGRHVRIVRRAGTDRRPIIKLHGVGDRAAAEALRGAQLTVAAQDAPQLGDAEWWAHELEGCEVFADRRKLGTVTRLIELPSCEVLEVRMGERGDPLLVPMVRDAIRQIDAVGRRIEIDPEFLDLQGARGGA